MMIVNDATSYSRVINYPPRVINYPSIMLLENIYSTGIIIYNHHIFKVQATGVIFTTLHFLCNLKMSLQARVPENPLQPNAA